jgi:nucleotide-binding universal stress UspA family protein
MTQTRAVIAAVDLDRKAEGVIRRATRLAGPSGLHLVVAHVVDHLGLFESDHIPVYTSAELETSLARYARGWVLGLLHHLDLPNVEVVVLIGNPSDAIANLARERGARTVVVGKPWLRRLGTLAGLGADRRIRALGCEVVTVAGVRGEQAGLASRLRTDG